MDGVFVVIIFLLVLVSLLFIFVSRFTKTTKALLRADYKLFLVLLPRELPKKADQQPVEGGAAETEQFKSMLNQAEHFIAAIGGLPVKNSFLDKLLGKYRHEKISFEIVVKDGIISFYVAIPNNLVNYLLQQIRASYKNVELEEVDDYNIFKPRCHIKGTYIKQTQPFYLPIKTYQSFESDPMEGLNNILSRLSKEESAVVQFTVRSAPKKWHFAAKNAVARIKRGEELYKKDENTVWKILKAIGSEFKDAFKSKSKDDPFSGAKKDDDKPLRLTPKEEEMAKLIEEKNAKAGLEVNIKVLLVGPNENNISLHFENIVNSFTKYNIYEYGNTLAPSSEKLDKIIQSVIFREFNEKKKSIFNTEELASLFHFPLPTTTTPNIKWLTSRKAPAPVNLPQEGIRIGRNVYRNIERVVRIAPVDRARHVYIIGTTGVGKSNLMQNMALQDIYNGEGVGVVDPHGDFVEYLLERIPKERFEDVVLFDPSLTQRPIGLNMLEAKTPEQKDFITQEMIQIFYKLVTDPAMIGPMFEHYMRNAMFTLMADENEPGTLVEIPRMFTDTDFQKYKLKSVKDPIVRAFWEKEMAQTTGQTRSDMLGYLISKVGRFIENEMMRNIIGQPKSGIDFMDIFQRRKILLVNLSKGKIGEVNSNLLGLILVSKLQMAAFYQANLPFEERKNFYLYIDEFQNYTTDSIATILSEARKYKLNLTMAHQYLGQLVKGQDTSIRDAVLGNVGTVISFRIGVEDAPTIAQIMAPVFGEYDLVNLEKFNAYVKMLVYNTVQRAFSIVTDPPIPGNPKQAQYLKELSMYKYGRPREEVEAEILERSKLGVEEKGKDDKDPFKGKSIEDFFNFDDDDF